MKKIILSLIVLLFANPALAYCDLEKLPFGDGIIEIAGKYNALEEPILPIAKGKNIFIMSGKNICSDFDEKSIAVLEFIDNKMVQLSFRDKNSDGYMLKMAEKNFGKAVQKNDAVNKKKANYQAVWGDESDLLIVYSVSKRQEFLRLTSKKEDKLFKKQSKEEEK